MREVSEALRVRAAADRGFITAGAVRASPGQNHQVRKHKSIRQPELFAEQVTARRRPSSLPEIGKQIIERGLPTPLEEYAFAAALGRAWRFDYCWKDYRVAYEREGATWGKVVTDAAGNKHRVVAGRHTSGAGVDKDAAKYNAAARLGWVVIRGTASTERNGQAIRDLELALRTKGWRP